MIYPLVILIATLGVAGFLTFYVFPKLIPVFASLNVNLPSRRSILLAVLNFLARTTACMCSAGSSCSSSSYGLSSKK